MATRQKSQIKYNQVNLQHSRAAIDNVMQNMSTENRFPIYMNHTNTIIGQVELAQCTGRTHTEKEI